MPSRSSLPCTAVLFAFVAVSPCAAQVSDTSRFTAAGISVSLVLTDAGARPLRAQAERVVRAGLEEYAAIFGGPPRDAAGRASRSLVVQLSTGVAGEGDSNPGIVTITAAERAMFGFYSWQLILLHELFHLWNAESVRYRDEREQWFNEGVTEFFTLRTAARRGFVAREAAPAIAATAAGFYSTAPGLGKVSLRAAARTPASKRANYFLIYEGGWLVGLIIDVDVRRRTNGAHSLDDLMRWLYTNRDAQQRRYALEDIVAGLKATSGIDYGDFMSRYVDGTVVLPIREYVDLGGGAFATYQQLAVQSLAARGQRAPTGLLTLDPALAAALGIAKDVKR